jgi:DNA-binding NarL/FixJ family response regulator
MGSLPHRSLAQLTEHARTSRLQHMLAERVSISFPYSLNRSERAILEYCAEGLDDVEIAARLCVERRDISVLRNQIARKLEARNASAHPFQIRDVVLAQSPDS